ATSCAPAAPGRHTSGRAGPMTHGAPRMSGSPTRVTRRHFMGAAVTASSVVAGFPTIVPASVFGQEAPSNRINVGAIGTGRISRVHDMPGIWRHPQARIVAVCDVDRARMDDAKTLVNGHYTKTTGKPYDGVTGYTDYRELLANADVD